MTVDELVHLNSILEGLEIKKHVSRVPIDMEDTIILKDSMTNRLKQHLD